MQTINVSTHGFPILDWMFFSILFILSCIENVYLVQIA